MVYYKRILILFLLLLLIPCFTSFSSCATFEFETGKNANNASVFFELYAPDEILALFHSSPYYNNDYKYIIFCNGNDNGKLLWNIYVVSKEEYPDFYFTYVSASNQLLFTSNNIDYHYTYFYEDDLPVSLKWYTSDNLIYSNIYNTNDVYYMWSTYDSFKFSWGSSYASRHFPDEPKNMDLAINKLAYSVYSDTLFYIFSISIPFIAIIILFIFGSYIIKFLIRRLK